MTQGRWTPPPQGQPWARTDARRLQIALASNTKRLGMTAVAGVGHTVTSDDDVVLVDVGAFVAIVVTLPLAASRVGIPVTVKKTDAGAGSATISASFGETIDGAATLDIPTQYQSYTLVSDGTTWWII